MRSLLGLAVPGEGSMTRALSTAQQPGLLMDECRPACERIHSRLRNLFTELHEMDRDDQLPSGNLLSQYVDVLTRYLRVLQHHHNKTLVFRVVRNRFIVIELQEFNKSVADLFVKLLDVDSTPWSKLWKEARCA
ncbi:hypothetical protein L914_11123, partial [Phytophthora nicotianae]